ncbi:MAG: molecular chaperone [Burkholderiaceae bacterium]|nr:molecular chaperone [Burkholderiaceae bacterium]
MKQLPFKHLVRGLLLSTIAASCQAGSIELSPVRVNLSRTVKVAVLTVRNTGAEESVMQVTLNKWALDGLAYSYTRSQELVVTPATFRLQPGAQQLVRIGLRGSAPQAREAAYRLLVEEVPPPPTAGVTQMRMVVRHDLPVFVAPVAAAKPALDISVECASDGARLRVTNIGNVHAQLRNLALDSGANSTTFGRWDTFDYLLPSAQKSWGLAQVAPGAVNKNFRLTALTDQGSFAADVKNNCS